MEDVTVTSSRPGSMKVMMFSAISPSSTSTGSSSAVTVGATLFTTSSNSLVEKAPWLSVAVMVMVCDWSGPSVEAKAQLHVPLWEPTWEMMPDDAETVTLSPVSTSSNPPVFLAVAPSSTAIVSEFTVMVGATLSPPFDPSAMAMANTTVIRNARPHIAVLLDLFGILALLRLHPLNAQRMFSSSTYA